MVKINSAMRHLIDENSDTPGIARARIKTTGLFSPLECSVHEGPGHIVVQFPERFRKEYGLLPEAK
jgi:hypothetical protein